MTEDNAEEPLRPRFVYSSFPSGMDHSRRSAWFRRMFSPDDLSTKPLGKANFLHRLVFENTAQVKGSLCSCCIFTIKFQKVL
jgi:hypothetical protein